MKDIFMDELQSSDVAPNYLYEKCWPLPLQSSDDIGSDKGVYQLIFMSVEPSVVA